MKSFFSKRFLRNATLYLGIVLSLQSLAAQDNPGWRRAESASPAESAAFALRPPSKLAPVGSAKSLSAAQGLASARVDFSAATPSASANLALAAPPVTPGGNEADEITPEITELARGLNYDPLRIFEYVYNFIESEPYYGSKKGAHLTLLESSGNDFDQSALLVALMRASGLNPSYKYGACNFSYAFLADWMGMSKTPYSYFSDAQFTAYFSGVPATLVNRQAVAAYEFLRASGYFYIDKFLDGSGNLIISIPHVWVELTVGGVVRKMSPAVKLHTDVTGIDIASAMGYSKATVLADVAGTLTTSPDSVTSLNYSNLSTRLGTYSQALKSYLKDNKNSLESEFVQNARRMNRFAYGSFAGINQVFDWPTAPWLAPQTWSAIPVSEMSKLKIRVGTYDPIFGQFFGTLLDQTINMPALRGRKLSLAWVGNLGRIRLDDQLVGSAFTASDSTVDIQLTASHNHFTRSLQNGAYVDSELGRNDQSETKSYLKGNGYAYAIVYTFSNPEKISAIRQGILDGYLRSGLTDSDWRVKTEMLNIIGLQWFSQVERKNRFIGSMFNCLPYVYHRFGRVGQEQGYYIDVGLQFSYFLNRDLNHGKEISFLQFESLVSSAMEHGVLEQMQGEGKAATSTVKMLYLANQRGIPIYRANSSNWSAVSAQLVSYPPQTLFDLQTAIGSSTNPATALIPKDGFIGLGQWEGYGIAQVSAVDVLMTISGNYYGGFNSLLGNLLSGPFGGLFGGDPLGRLRAGLLNPGHDPLTTPQKLGVDPVDMLSGAFVLESSDLTLGQDVVTRGLSFTRQYDSSRTFDQSAGLGRGWTHHDVISLSKRSSTTPALGGSSSYHATPFYAAMQVAADLYQTESTNAKGWTTSALAVQWAVDQLSYNAVDVMIGNRIIEFIKMPDGSYEPPSGMNLTLTRNGAGATETFTMTERNGPTYTFNTAGNIASITDLWNKTQTFTYTSGALSSITDGYGRTLTITRSGGKITSVSDANSRIVSYGYTGDNLTSYTDPEGKIWSYTYDSNHRMVTTLDPSSRTVVANTYDSLGRVSEQLNQGNTNRRYFLTYTGRYNVEEDPAGGRITYFYDERGRSSSVVDQLGNRSRTLYDGQDRITRDVTPKLELANYVYDKNNNLTRESDPILKETVMAYDSQNRVTQATDKRGFVTTFNSYNTQHQPLSVTAPLARTTSMTYTATGQVSTMTDAENNVTRYFYNALGQLTSTTINNQAVSTMLYNSYGDIASMTDALSRTTAFTYNKRRQLLTTTLPAVPGQPAAVITNTYNNEGLLATSTDANGNVTSQTYSATGKPLVTTSPAIPVSSGGTLNNTITTVYNNRDLPETSTDSLGQTMSIFYDSALRVTEMKDPLNRSTLTAYDENSRPTQMTDALSRVTKTAYTLRSEPNLATDALLKTTASVFDENGNRTSLTNRREKNHSFAYDNASRLISSTTPTGKATVMTYFKNDLPKTITEASGQVTTLTYDNRVRLATKVDPVGSVSYGYTVANELSTVTQGAAVITRLYDERSRLKSFTTADGDIIQYLYDPQGNLTRLTYPDGKQVNYTYNARNALATVTDWSSRTTSYQYDRIGRLTGITRPNGTTASFAHDVASQLLSIREAKSGKLFSYLSFQYDAAGQIKNRLQAPLLQSGFQHPTLTATYDDDNRLLTANGTAVTHDADGNMTSGPIQRGTGVSPASSALTYNSRNQLTTASGISYTYDAEGRRRTSTDATGTTRDVIDPNGSKLLVRNHPNGTKTYYVYGLGLLYEANQTNQTKTYHFDQVGSTIARTDDSGNIIARASYSAYGLITVSEGDMATPFRYNGQAGVQTDLNGLLFMRARYYSPYLMRFLNADPIGFSGGSNWFAYADGNPVSKFDPFGLATVGVGLQVGGGLGLGITLSAGVYVGKSGWNPLSGWSSGLLFSGGGGIEAGAGGSGAIFAQVTDAPNVNNLKGPGFEVGASGGELLVGGVDYVGGLGNTNGNNFPVNTTTFKGVSLNLGVGGGTPLEGHANVTGTAGWTTNPWSSSAPASSAPSSHNPFKPTIGPQLNSYGGSKSSNK